jgi:hypothetical protein
VKHGTRARAQQMPQGRAICAPPPRCRPTAAPTAPPRHCRPRSLQSAACRHRPAAASPPHSLSPLCRQYYSPPPNRFADASYTNQANRALHKTCRMGQAAQRKNENTTVGVIRLCAAPEIPPLNVTVLLLRGCRSTLTLSVKTL